MEAASGLPIAGGPGVDWDEMVRHWPVDSLRARTRALEAELSSLSPQEQVERLTRVATNLGELPEDEVEVLPPDLL